MPHIHEKIDFTVEVFIVHKNKVLLRLHDKFKIWLSVGGHIELDEEPNQAAVREVKEEVGLDITLVGKVEQFKQEDEGHRQLIPPKFMKIHRISPIHEHVVFTYFATTESDDVKPEKADDEWKWVNRKELDAMDLKPDIRFYAEEALKELGRPA